MNLKKPRASVLLALPVFVLVVAGFFVASAYASLAAPTMPNQVTKFNNGVPLKPTVVSAVHFDISPPLRSITPLKVQPGAPNPLADQGPIPAGPVGKVVQDPVVQRLIGPLTIPTPIVSFNGPPNLCGGCAPPDPNGEVGPNHVVVMSNLSFQIFSKTGTSLFGPAANNTLWAGFGGGCQTRNDGDPVVLYDQLADRWLLAQFTSAAPYLNCLALSQTSDPTGAYYRWAFPVGGGNNFGDYEKFGMWPDAYHISTREFAGGSTFVGVGAYAADRAQMLAGNPNPTVVSFLAPPSPAYVVGDGLLPADLDGTRLPPAGSDEYYMGSEDNNGPYGAPADALTLWKFHADFVTPGNSSFMLVNTIPTAPFNSILALCGGGRACIPQPGTANRIDHLGYRQRPLFRLAYRNMGTFENLLTNQSVSAGTGPNGEVSGIRWWEVRSPASGPSIYQEGTYAPGLTDGIHRWMGSIAMNGVGSIGLGYSASNGTNPSVFPSVYYTGRLSGDPLGQMPQGEAAIVNGTGSQTAGGNRWGDYTDMTVDPTDDCTFWYVNEYVPTTSGAGWQLRIGSYQFGPCTQGTPTPTATGTPPTPTRTSTPTNTVAPTNTPPPSPTPDPCLVGNYTITSSTGATVVPATTLVPGSNCDDCSSTVALPFPFRLYDQTFNSVNAISNGNLQFSSTDTTFTNTCLPYTAANYAILPHWDDLLLTGAGQGIYTLVEGTSPNRVFDIEWRGGYFSGGGTVDFEVRLFENSTTFEVIYGTVTQTGTSATVGVQRANGAGAQFTQYSCNTSGLSAGQKLTFTSPVCNTATPTTAVTNTATATHTSAPTNTVGPTNTPGGPTDTPEPTITPGGPTDTPQPTSTVCPITFTDVPQGSTFYDFIRCLACRGIINGYSDGTFRPNNNVTRGQLSKIVSNSAGFIDPQTTQMFQDVPVGSTFFDFVGRLASRGYIGGYPCGTVPSEPCIAPDNLPYFRPNNNATRGQISKIVSNSAGFIDPAVGQTFEDVAPGSTFYDFIERLASRGVMGGYPCNTIPSEPCVPPDNRPYFRPNNNATRGQTSKIVANTFFPACVTPSSSNK